MRIAEFFEIEKKGNVRILEILEKFDGFNGSCPTLVGSDMSCQSGTASMVGESVGIASICSQFQLTRILEMRILKAQS